jgi:TfoX/Sxy family transcriptional regulator of competence genes
MAKSKAAHGAAMKMPSADAGAVEQFGRLAPSDPAVTVRKVFGHPAAFVHGNMFFGVFGADLFVRLSDSGRAEALSHPDVHLFEPMKGRPMKEYVVLPDRVRAVPAEAKRWVARSLEHVSTFPPKKPGRR